MKRLLIVANAPSPNARRLLQAAECGARDSQIAGVEVSAKLPLAAAAEDVLSADALIIGTTENFGQMSGLMKDFFERIYYPCLEKTEAKPYALYVRAGKDGTGTVRGITAITTGLRWRITQPPLMMVGAYNPLFAEQCQTLGTTIAASLESDLL
ncbi:MAG: NAD(P)H-dependent oxidoreductase [Gammaproteobacteria bacterium]